MVGAQYQTRLAPRALADHPLRFSHRLLFGTAELGFITPFGSVSSSRQRFFGPVFICGQSNSTDGLFPVFFRNVPPCGLVLVIDRFHDGVLILG